MSRFLAVFLGAIAALVCAALPAIWAASVVQVDPQTRFFRDEQGRALLFHGVNVVYKTFPFVPVLDHFDPMNSLSEEDMNNLTEWGFNVVRLGVMWPGVEPQEAQFNQTYLALMRSVVDRLGSHGIYTIVDLHQDAWSDYFCGEGVPDYIVQHSRAPFLPFAQPILKDPLPTDDAGHPELRACLQTPFFKYYFTAAVSRAFQCMYDDVNGLQEYLARFWQHVAVTFADSPFVLGYELLNEPWAGDIYWDPLLLLQPGRADRQNLAPLYRRLHDAIRAVDDQHIVFFEPAVSDYANNGFTEGPGGPSYNNRQALSYHIYCQLIDEHGDPRAEPFCDLDEDVQFGTRLADMRRLSVGGFLTEFGADSNHTRGMDDLVWMTSAADRALQSWSYWQFKFYQDITTANPDESEGFYSIDGTLQMDKVAALSRSYPQRTAGTPLSLAFDNRTAALRYTFAADPSIAAPTEIYVHEAVHYPRGLVVQVQPAAVSYARPRRNLVTVDCAGKVAPGTPVTVTITRAGPAQSGSY